jgi:hypothetical protein
MLVLSHKPVDVDGYMQDAGGIVTYTDEKDIERRVWGYPIWNLHCFRLGEVGASLHFDTQFDYSTWVHVVIPVTALNNRQMLRDIVLNNGLGLQEDDTKGFIKFMTTFVEQMRSKKTTAPQEEKIGWSVDATGKPAGFTYGSTRFNCNGNTPYHQTDSMIRRIRRWICWRQQPSPLL